MDEPTRRGLAVAGAVGLVAMEVGLGLALSGSRLHTALKLLMLAILPAAIAAVVLFRGSRRTRTPAEETAPPARRLTELYKAKGHIQPGWFVSFTAGPYPTEHDRRGDYITAIAEVTAVDGDDVELEWRDRVQLPRRVPVALLDANRVVRLKDGHRINSGNEGLLVPSLGALVAGPGWNAHRTTPAHAARARVTALTAEQRTEFEAEADLATYDIAALS